MLWNGCLNRCIVGLDLREDSYSWLYIWITIFNNRELFTLALLEMGIHISYFTYY